MAVDSINSGSSYVSQAQPQPSSARVAEKENDNDTDDGRSAAAAANAAPKATVNTSGQTIGSIINVQA